MIASPRPLRFYPPMRFLKSSFVFAALAALSTASVCHAAASAFVEAESFDNPGGWVLDTQFIEIMGSPYLMAHGMGRPVKDAETTVAKSPEGKARIWVRTKNWVG